MLSPEYLVNEMRYNPSYFLFAVGSEELDEIMQAQFHPYGADAIWEKQKDFEQAFAGFQLAEILGFRDANC